MANVAGEGLRGFETEARYAITADLTLAASASYHNATFTQYLFFDGTTNVDVSGRHLTLSPHAAPVGGYMTPISAIHGGNIV